MAIFGLLNKKEASSLVTDALAAQKKMQSIIDQLTVESLDRSKADVEIWRLALREWEDAILPDRYPMMQLYREIVQDDSVATHMNTIISRISGTDFEIGTENGETFTEDEDLEKVLCGTWFDEIIRLIIEAEMMGFTLVEIKPGVNGGYTPDSVSLIPRHLLIPEQGKVRTRAQVSTQLIDYTLPAYASRLMQIGDKSAKGLFNNLALLYIYKKNALAFWANYQSKYGIPPLVIKTDLTNKAGVDALSHFAGEMRNNSFTLAGFNDEITTLSGVSTDAFQTFKNMIDHCDAQIAKVLEGQTMTSNDGSSRSQAEVHERTADEWHKARLRTVERYVNTQLLPILERDGIAVSGKVFRFKESRNVDAIIDRLVKIKLAGFSMDEEQASSLTGYKLTTAAVPAPVVPPVDPSKDEKPNASIVDEIEALYNQSLV